MAGLLAQHPYHAGLLQGREPREELRGLGTRGELVVGEGVDLGAHERVRRVHAHLGADGRRHELVVAGEHLDGHAAALELDHGLGGACLGRVEEGQVADEHHVTLVFGREGPGRAWVGLLRHGHDAHALRTQLAHLDADALAEVIGERGDRPCVLHVRARGQNLLHGALGDHLGLARLVRHHDAHEAALEVEGDLVHLAVALIQRRGVEQLLAALHDCAVDEVAQARLEAGVEVGVAQHSVVLVAHDVHVAFEHDLVLGEGAGLVAAQHVHGAEILDGGQLLDDDVPAAHLLGAAGEAGGHDDRQHLRGDAHGNRHREEQGIEPVALGEAAREEDDGAHHEHEAHEHARDVGDATVEGRGAGGVAERAGELADAGVTGRGNGDRRGRAALHRGAGERDVGAVGESEAGRGDACLRGFRVRRDGGGDLLDRLGLAGEGALVHEEVLGLENAQVGGHEVAGSEADDVAGHDLGHGELLLGLASADDAAGVGHELLERSRGARALALLYEREDARDSYHHGDDDGGGGVAVVRCGKDDVGVERDAREGDEDERERRGECRHDATGERGPAGSLDDVGAVELARGGEDVGREAAIAAPKLGEGLGGGVGGGEDDELVELARAGGGLRVRAQDVQCVRLDRHGAPPDP